MPGCVTLHSVFTTAKRRTSRSRWPADSSVERADARWLLYACSVILLSLVSDGWAGKPSPLAHQVGLLPFTLTWVVVLYLLLWDTGPQSSSVAALNLGARKARPFALLGLQIWSVLLVLLEAHHFQRFGYHLGPISHTALACANVLLVWTLKKRKAQTVLIAMLFAYATGVLIAIRDFPLNYLRSDMLPVISWADERLLRGLNPYGTMFVGGRVYDFPYLPGVLVSFLPASLLHIDLRYVNLFCVLLLSWLVFLVARPGARGRVATLIGLFVLCPFLQYRHDIYLQPHWLSLVGAVVLMQRRRPLAAGFVWGLSCGIYQLSWIVVPFAVLNAYRSQGWRRAIAVVISILTGLAVMTGPFLSSAYHRIANNTVGQWSRLPHALADPINLSYWLTYLIRPDQLKWVQAALLTALFGYCWWKKRCVTLADTLRWMCVALAVFIPLNVLVDGYFYLTLLLMLMLFVCAANEWWADPEGLELKV